jgi:predicted dehydrogenase
MATAVRFGTLGAARITPVALVRPARQVAEATLDAVAARDRTRADAFAAKHGIPRVHASYDDLIADPDLDAIYVPLPNGRHAEWAIRAMEAGKHVLCEKPLTSNADQAREVAAAAARTGRVLVEAFHWRYHPMAQRMIDVVRSGELGEVRHVESSMCIPLPMLNDIRYQLDLGGGAVMDTGCYTISMVRHLAGEEPEVRSAQATMLRRGVDRAMQAELSFASGATGRVTCSLLSRRLFAINARVVGTLGELRAFNPVGPQYGPHGLRIRTEQGSRRERFTRTPTYVFQLQAFCDAVLRGTSVPTGPDDAIANMEVVDAVYRAAHLDPRH